MNQSYQEYFDYGIRKV